MVGTGSEMNGGSVITNTKINKKILYCGIGEMEIYNGLKEGINKKYKQDLRVAKKSRLVSQIQMIYQDPIGSLNPRMTVGEIISEGLIIKGIKDKEYIRNKVYETLELVGLVKEHATRYPHEFSGGQRQRIGIARSLIMEPEMIIADEPVSALDVSIQAQVINLMNKLKKELGLTILFIAHDLSVVKYFSDRIGVMYLGHMMELGPSNDVYHRPLHPYTIALLSAIPISDPNIAKAKQRIILIGDDEAVRYAIRNTKGTKRLSALCQKMKNQDWHSMSTNIGKYCRQGG